MLQTGFFFVLESNNGRFYWRLDIGETNWRSISQLFVNWAYGVEAALGRGNIHSIVQKIDDMGE